MHRHNVEVSKDCHILASLIICVKFCGVFQSAFRGKDESEGSSNPGFFFLDLVGSLGEVCEEGGEELLKTAKTDCMLSVIREWIIEEVKQMRPQAFLHFTDSVGACVDIHRREPCCAGTFL